MARLTFALMAVLSFSFTANAQQLSEDEKQVVYQMNCETKSLIESGALGDHKLTSADVKSITGMAEEFQAFLKEPKKESERLLNTGDWGGFGLVVACSQINDLSTLLLEKGCKDLKGESINVEEGVKLCKRVIDGANKKK